MPCLLLDKKVDAHDTSAVRLLNYQDYLGVIYLSVHNLKTNSCYNLSHNMEIYADWLVRSLADLDTRIIRQMNTIETGYRRMHLMNICLS